MWPCEGLGNYLGPELYEKLASGSFVECCLRCREHPRQSSRAAAARLLVLTLLPAANCIVLAARHLLRDLWAVHTDIKELFQFVRLFSFSFSVSLEQEI